MDRDKALLSQDLHEFLIISADYLDVELDSVNMETMSWRVEKNIDVMQNSQEVGYATNRLSS